MTPRLNEIWVYLAASPLLGLTITLVAYQGAFWLYRRSGMNPLANPVLISVTALVALLSLTGTSYQTYFDGAQFVHFLLGPATVALAVPLYTQFRRVRAMLLPVLLGLVAGSLTAVLSAIAIGKVFGASTPTLLSLAPKSVTTPIAMGVAERIGGIPSLTAVLVIATGILGAVGARYLFDAMKLRDPAIRGFAIGVASHGIGTARAFQVSEQAGAFAALAMGLNGMLTALLLPALVPLLSRWLG
jgi:predicted murein hydrolase (TIGR00659 family)